MPTAAEWMGWVGDDFEADDGAGWFGAGVKDGRRNTPTMGGLGTEEDIGAEEGDDDDLSLVGVAASTVAGFVEPTRIAGLLRNRHGSSLSLVGQSHLESGEHGGDGHSWIAADGNGGDGGDERGGDGRK